MQAFILLVSKFFVLNIARNVFKLFEKKLGMTYSFGYCLPFLKVLLENYVFQIISFGCSLFILRFFSNLINRYQNGFEGIIQKKIILKKVL